MIAEGTEWVARRFPDRRGIAYRATLFLLLAYPCWETFVNLSGRPVREFNIHGDLHRNVFIDRDLKR